MSSTFRMLDYNFVFDDINLYASSEDANFPLSNLQDFSVSRVFRTTSSDEQRITFDLLTPEVIDSFFVMFDRQNQIRITSGATIKLQGNPTEDWTSPLVDITLSIDDTNHCIKHLLSDPEQVECRFWSLYIDDPANPWGYLELGKVLFGRATRLSQMPDIGFKTEIADLSQNSVTAYGAVYADTYPSQRRAFFSHKILTEDDKNTLREIYLRLGNVKPILCVLDGEEEIFGDGNEHLVYGYLDNSFDASQVFLTFFDVDMVVKEAL